MVKENNHNNRFKINKKFLKILPAIISIAAIVLYYCPIYYVKVWEYPGMYFSAIKSLDSKYFWVLYTSVILLLISIFLSFYTCFAKETKKPLQIFSYVVYALALIFCILIFVLAFAFFNNYPRSF